jgi:hypothetical protein
VRLHPSRWSRDFSQERSGAIALILLTATKIPCGKTKKRQHQCRVPAQQHRGEVGRNDNGHLKQTAGRLACLPKAIHIFYFETRAGSMSRADKNWTEPKADYFSGGRGRAANSFQGVSSFPIGDYDETVQRQCMVIFSPCWTGLQD